MSDITKCTNEECHLKYFCRRHNAPSNEHWQSWANMSDFSNSGKSCHNRLPDKCPHCGKTDVHKLGCETRKAKVNIRVDEW